MIKAIVNRFSQGRSTPESTITSAEVILEALCAYRDQLIMSDDYGLGEVGAKLMLLHMEIDSVSNQIRLSK